MDKKDAVFIATTLMIKDKFKDFNPEEKIETNKQYSELFITLNRYLSQLYDKCQ
ncbi:MAG: hypothetical protein FD156_468 [Nitrospirae bacterium]|nr:MAG: hypothetical protein FD156_468 [Nitrospirota bacterium]